MPTINRREFTIGSLAGISAGVFAHTAAAQTANQPAAAATATGAEDRQYWVKVIDRLARPVLAALAQRKLKQTWTVRSGGRQDRSAFAPLEALGRLLTGIAPWLETSLPDGPENRLRLEFADLARQAIDASTDPPSPDKMNFTTTGQPLVDAAFLAHAMLRAPGELWKKLDARVQENVVTSLVAARVTNPPESNWLLFCAMIEALFFHVGRPWLPERVARAVSRHEQWYKGDGAYGDGPTFHWDYYNSFVIHPMLLDVLATVGEQQPAWNEMLKKELSRGQRYAAVQERMISPEGTFPPIGRSLAYRFGAFQLLGHFALRRELAKPLQPAQVRCAMTAVIRRMIEAPGTFDDKGFLTIGFCGVQPSVAETYISTGSLYLCAAGLLPLGLPPTDEFWTAPALDWTAKRMWSGQDVPADHAMTE